CGCRSFPWLRLLLQLHTYHGMTNNLFAQRVASLKFFAYNFNRAITFFHRYRFMQPGIEHFTDGRDALDTHIRQSFFKLLDDSLYTLNIVVARQIGWHM